MTANVCALDVFSEVRFMWTVSFTDSGQCFAFPQRSTSTPLELIPERQVSIIEGGKENPWTDLIAEDLVIISIPS